MKRTASLVVLVVLAASVIAAAAGLISKAQAERDALKAVNGGSVIQVLGTQGRLRIWSVDIAQATHEYEVHVDARAGAILKIIVQPGGTVNGRFLLTRPEAEHEAENAPGGTVLDASSKKKAPRRSGQST
jgi:hypothetical protein